MNDSDSPAGAAPDGNSLDLAQQKSASRQRDWDDIAAGRRTPEQVHRDNTRPFWGDIDFTKIVILNEH